MPEGNLLLFLSLKSVNLDQKTLHTMYEAENSITLNLISTKRKFGNQLDYLKEERPECHRIFCPANIEWKSIHGTNFEPTNFIGYITLKSLLAYFLD